jgi:hypothetical protein
MTKYTQNITIPGSINPNITYGLSAGRALRIVTIFDEIFPSFYTAANTTAQGLLRCDIALEGAIVTRSLDFNPWIFPNDVPNHILRFASAMTNAIRSVSSESAIGQAFNRETFVQVYWAWITLPLLIVILTIVFLLSTISKTSKKKRRSGYLEDLRNSSTYARTT